VNKKSNIAIIISIIAFFIVVMSMNYGCQNTTPERENNKSEIDYQKAVKKINTLNLDVQTPLPQNNAAIKDLITIEC